MGPLVDHLGVPAGGLKYAGKSCREKPGPREDGRVIRVNSGSHYNDACCFDYDNAETNGHDTRNGHMEAIYHGNCDVWGTCSGSGPWVTADLENGLLPGENTGENSADPSIYYRFVTTMLKGESSQWAIRGANTVSDSLMTYCDGEWPDADGYNPMSKEGALILGIGGDNSNGAQGTFYKGVITSGYPDNDTEDKVQADIVDAGYATTSLTSGPELAIDESISLPVTTMIASVDTPGSYIWHSGFELYLGALEDTQLFYEDATFCPLTALSGSGNSIRSWSYPTRYIRHYNILGYIASNGGVHTFESASSFNADASWLITSGFAS
ncbi:hypothetical protein N7481_009209 [Penicillium waksmanii]|uniref:uncharacterized protein n=1 Tax=Penicillium waksmanii TaxID=69791 RepID=UPI0025489E42|nr:uncharacterized protein N7481_009209 [Penicillium waksmanii]KAJ5975502.1 hypothetical protein N7481_009209 [Penicillium waksmanii]